jgi:hypothetical protein
MSQIGYHLVEGEKVQNVVAFFPDEPQPIKSADSNHPYWTEIVRGLRNNDPDVVTLFDVKAGLGAKLRSLSDRVDFDAHTNTLFFDGDVVDDALAQQVVRFLEQGVSDWEPLVKFWENVAQNPSEHSRENLYRWLRTHEFSITANGEIVAYKGVKVGSAQDGAAQYQSIHAGPAWVNGEHVNGYVPNEVGAVVTMPRADVTANPAVGCHVGLHVGTHSYAKSFGHGVTLEVHVNPRDVVSVPTECSDAKMRVCKYTVAGKVEGAYSSAVVIPEEDYDDWEGDVGYDPNDF